MPASKYNLRNIWIFYGVFLLIFLQLLTDFVESIYVFGLLRVSLTPEVAAVILLFSPLVLLAWRKQVSPVVLLVMGGGALVARLATVWLGPSGRLLASGLGVGCWLVAFPAWLCRVAALPRPENFHHALAFGMGLALALGSSALLRTLGSGFDLSMYGRGQVIGWLLALVAGWEALRLFCVARSLPDSPQVSQPDSQAAMFPRFRFARMVLMSLGIFSVLELGHFVLMSPNVVARWTEVDYPFVLTALMAALGVFAVVLSLFPVLRIRLPVLPWRVPFSSWLIWLWNVGFLLALLLTVGAHQMVFPADPGAYPLAEPSVTSGVRSLPLLMLLLSPVALVDFVICVRELLSLKPTPAQLGGAFALAILALLGFMLAQIFTTVYAYIPVVGPWFRDRFWLVFLGVGLGCWLPILGARRLDPVEHQPSVAFGAMMALLCGVTVVFGWALVSRPPAPPTDLPSLRVVTYNVQQGYSPAGVKSFAGQLALLRETNADLIGLQETDTNRIAGGNADLLEYFARNLDMYAYYGPKTVAGTFGIALLSRYPLVDPRTFYLYSAGEQTATIVAQVRVGERDFYVYVTHLDNDGPPVQQDAVLALAREDHVILMGDFNFTPASESYRMTLEILRDAWSVQEAAHSESPGFDSMTRIDHIFVSPGMRVAQTRYLDNVFSDHPLLWADLVIGNP